MILAVNIGNTNINLGLFDDDILVSNFRISVKKWRQDECFIEEAWNNISKNGIEDIIIASVNPGAESIFCKWLKAEYDKPPLKIGSDIQSKIHMDVKAPEKVGIDRIANSTAAYRRINKGVIVVDMGTATTFDVVSNKGIYLGGVIAPGLRMGANSLYTETQQLPLVEARKIKPVLGKNTTDAMISGIYWGFTGSVKLILERLIDEMEFKPIVIATGGDAELIAETVEYISEVIPNLTLEGIKIIYMENR